MLLKQLEGRESLKKELSVLRIKKGKGVVEEWKPIMNQERTKNKRLKVIEMEMKQDLKKTNSKRDLML